MQLLQRSSRHVALTAAGKILYDAAQDALKRIQEATAEIQRPLLQRPLLISCERSLAMRWLIPRLSGFQDANPEIPVYLSSGGGAIDLMRENIDIAIRRADFELDPRVIAVPLFAEYVGPVVAAGKSAATRLHTTGRPEAWDFWSKHGEGRANKKTRERGVTTAAGSKAKDQYFDHFFLSLQAAEAGLGSAIAPLFLVAGSLASGRLLAPAGFIPDGSQYIAMLRKPLAPDTPERHFMQWLQAEVAETMAQTEKYRPPLP